MSVIDNNNDNTDIRECCNTQPLRRTYCVVYIVNDVGMGICVIVNDAVHHVDIYVILNDVVHHGVFSPTLHDSVLCLRNSTTLSSSFFVNLTARLDCDGMLNELCRELKTPLRI